MYIIFVRSAFSYASGQTIPESVKTKQEGV